MATYKEQHEAFVSGHNGTTVTEITLATSVACISCFARDILTVFLSVTLVVDRVEKSFLLKFFMDFVILVVPNVLIITVLNSHIASLLLLILIGSAGLSLYLFKQTKYVKNQLPMSCINLNEKKTFLTYVRSIINLCTAIGILAVDFPVFPRRFAKAEIFGFGMMDTGVGFFVVANATVSPEARGKSVVLSPMAQLKKAVCSSLPLLTLGMARLAAVKGIDYHEHMTEYGVHWNFFFTLAVLKIVSSLLACFIPSSQSGLLGVAVLVGHQLFLSHTGSDYILHGLDGKGGRHGLIDSNREGIYSLPGYIAIYMLGVHLGSFLFQQRKNLSEWLTAAKHLTIMVAVCTIFMVIFHFFVQPVSRRFANASYICWIMSACCGMLLECLVGDIIVTYFRSVFHLHPSSDVRSSSNFKEKQSRAFGTDGPVTRSRTKETENYVHEYNATKRVSSKDDQQVSDNQRSDVGISSCSSWTMPCIMEAITYNSLLFFLMANVMTGGVNMTIPTIHTGPWTAVIVVLVYSFLLCTVIVVLKFRNMSTKIW